MTDIERVLVIRVLLTIASETLAFVRRSASLICAEKTIEIRHIDRTLRKFSAGNGRMSIISDFGKRTRFIHGLAVILLLGAQAHAASGRDEPIDHVLKQLPSDVFDETTDGISEDELRKLIETGETQDWRLQRKYPYRAVITDRNPHTNTEITVYLFFVDNDQVIKTMIQNEQLYTEHYFRMNKRGGLERFSPTKKLKIKLKSLQ